MDFAAAVSEHPLATHATGEVVGELLERLGGPPDLAVLFVTGPHVGVLEDIAATVHRLLSPGTLVGCTAVSVLAGAEEVEGTPGVALWGGATGAVSAHHVEVVQRADGPALVGVDGADLEAAATALLLADPATFPDDIAAGATSLRAAAGAPLDRIAFTAGLLAAVEARYGQFLAGGFAAIRPAFEATAFLTGRAVRVSGPDAATHGRVVGVDDDGALLLTRDDGGTQRVLAGEVTLRDGGRG